MNKNKKLNTIGSIPAVHSLNRVTARAASARVITALVLSLLITPLASAAPAPSSSKAGSSKSASEVLALDEAGFMNYQLEQAMKMHDPRVEDWPFYATVKSPHQIRVIEDGLASLELRLQMIEKAKTSIEFMTYITSLDRSGRLIAKALMDSARRGVRVRILLDWYLNGSMENVFAAGRDLLVKEGVPAENFEVRFYNKGNMLGDPIKMNHRNHAKLLVVDGHELMMGGRNTENDYFQMTGMKVNFVDRDVWVRNENVDVRSSVPMQAQAAFTAYWTDPEWVMPANPKKPGSLDSLMNEGEDRKDLETRAAIVEGSGKGLGEAKAYTVNELTFVIDRPGHKMTDRRVTPVLHWRLANTDQSIVIENYATPLMPSKIGLLGFLSEKRQVPITILTNCILSNDDAQLVSLSQKSDRSLLSKLKNIWVFYMSGKPLEGAAEIQIPGTSQGVYATHAKSGVLFSKDRTSTVIGSYNFDGRSEYLNNETVLIIDNDYQIGLDVSNSIRARELQMNPVTVGQDRHLWYFAPEATRLSNAKTPLETVTGLLGLSKVLLKEY